MYIITTSKLLGENLITKQRSFGTNFYLPIKFISGDCNSAINLNSLIVRLVLA
jgi:hypothetical protein